jgi:hypothetical protein
MLNIVNELRSDESLGEVMIYTSMATLILAYPQKGMNLGVYWDFDLRKYYIYKNAYSSIDKKWIENHVQTLDAHEEIIPYIKEELNRMIDLP